MWSVVWTWLVLNQVQFSSVRGDHVVKRGLLLSPPSSAIVSLVPWLLAWGVRTGAVSAWSCGLSSLSTKMARWRALISSWVEWRLAKSAEPLQSACSLVAWAACSHGLCRQRWWPTRTAYAQHAGCSQKVIGRITSLSAESGKMRIGLELGRPAWQMPLSSFGGTASGSCRVCRLQWIGDGVHRDWRIEDSVLHMPLSSINPIHMLLAFFFSRTAFHHYKEVMACTRRILIPGNVHVDNSEKKSLELHFNYEEHSSDSTIDIDHATGLEKVDLLGDDDS
ncbi:hypothetical protein KSP39_PZI009597 [Platanthera zijinensis]|uniref:Secreted protein n=1 Tax=Platanthera zijinensis TaxID=2320716 RepID=A0AAP0BLN5_9ASPA